VQYLGINIIPINVTFIEHGIGTSVMEEGSFLIDTVTHDGGKGCDTLSFYLRNVYVLMFSHFFQYEITLDIRTNDSQGLQRQFPIQLCKIDDGIAHRATCRS
jgi:hypothetical protein